MLTIEGSSLGRAVKRFMRQGLIKNEVDVTYSEIKLLIQALVV